MSLVDKTGVEIVTACCRAEFRWDFCVFVASCFSPWCTSSTILLSGRTSNKPRSLSIALTRRYHGQGMAWREALNAKQ